ncbi:MAG: metallophosphoesterase family protein [Nanoarchaeota archaeon]|nr:metallophosphoesterase family protein [Nanoarchaeota archaeon]MBU1945332.1 metallophosphoesterase family protein [Nanoarchaeota archaeon]
MKLLAFVDLHGSHKALEEIKKKSKKADMILCAGDVSIFENDLQSILHQLNKLNKKVLIIPGNHESGIYITMLAKPFKNIVNIHKKLLVHSDIVFLGYGGGGFSMVDKQFEKISKKMERDIKKNKGKKVILITHAPPYKTKIDKIMEEHCGNKSIKRFILKIKPDLVISGHLHENAGKHDKIEKTKVINPGPFGKIISI